MIFMKISGKKLKNIYKKITKEVLHKMCGTFSKFFHEKDIHISYNKTKLCNYIYGERKENEYGWNIHISSRR